MMVGGPHGVFLVALVLSRTFALPQPIASVNDVEDDYFEEKDPKIFLRETRKHARPMFYINCSYRSQCYCYSRTTRHHYCCSCSVGTCFPASAQVATSSHTYTTMSDLRTGDEVLAVDETGKVVTSSVLGFMDRRPNERALYLTLRTAIGRNLTLSPNHVLFKSAPNSSYPISVFGSDINVGDVIFSVNKTGLERTEVVAIEHSINLGAYVPLTKEGTLVVDGTLASCYASYHHSLAHAFLAPARAFPSLLWPRPGFISNLALLLKHTINIFTTGSSDTLQSFSGEADMVEDEDHLQEKSTKEVCSRERMDGTKPERDYCHGKSKAYKSGGNVRFTSLSGEDLSNLEGEGEAYYITFVKFVGYLLFGHQKAAPQVLQVNPVVPEGKGMSQFVTFTHSIANLLDLLPRSW